jgi:hypothetical protein
LQVVQIWLIYDCLHETNMLGHKLNGISLLDCRFV